MKSEPIVSQFSSDLEFAIALVNFLKRIPQKTKQKNKKLNHSQLLSHKDFNESGP